MTQPTEPLVFGDDPNALLDETMAADAAAAEASRRRVWPALVTGFRRRCPQCREGRIFARYTKINETCGTCGQDFTGHRADDAPPYFTMLIAGHLIVPLMVEGRKLPWPMGVQLLFWGGLLVGLTLWLLPRVKGALINFQWANRMHGFSDAPDEDPEDPLKA